MPGSVGLGWLLAVAGYSRALLFNGLGRYPAALEAALEAARYEDLAVLRWTLGELVEAAARAGADTVAAEARDRLAARTRVVDTNWARGAQALADALAGPAGSAEENYREAIERFAATRLGLQLARARLLYGEWLRRENRRADARAQLRIAHEAFTTIGADGFAERASRELAATGETVQADPGAREEFTPQEAQIMRLAVAGAYQSGDRRCAVPQSAYRRMASAQDFHQARHRLPPRAGLRPARQVTPGPSPGCHPGATVLLRPRS